jgi:hypothetical protein
MPHRKLVFLLALAVFTAAPATASAAPSVTVTGDDGNPAALNPTTPFGLRNMDITVTVAVPASDTRSYTAQIFAPDSVAATPASSCIDPRFSTSTRGFPSYRGNGTYTVVLRYFAGNATCTGTATERRFQYTINAGTGVTPPPTRVLTRPANSLVTNNYDLGVALNPGAFGYEVRYARGGVVGPDGAISGPSSETFVNTSTGLASVRFDKPGRYVIVARAKNGDFFTPWSAAAVVNAIAPFDIDRVTFPDARGPRYKLRGRVRETAARGSRVTIYIARRWKGGKFRRLGRARVNSKGRFTKRFNQRGYGKYRLRYTFRGNNLVAAGRITQRVTIRRTVFFG